MPMNFKKRSEYAAINAEQPEPEASAPAAAIPTAAEPQTSTEWKALSDKLLGQKHAVEQRCAEAAAEAQLLALRAELCDVTAQRRLDELVGVAETLKDAARRIADAWQECVRKLTEAEAFETQAAADAKRAEFERMLRESLTLAEQSDQRLSDYAQVMNQRQQILMQAQGLASSGDEKARVRQLLNKQGPSWAMGFFGVPKFIEQTDFMFYANFNTLAAFTRVRLQNWGVVAPTEPTVAPPPPVKQRVN